MKVKITYVELLKKSQSHEEDIYESDCLMAIIDILGISLDEVYKKALKYKRLRERNYDRR